MNYSIVLQNNVRDCGVACICTLLKFYKIDVDYTTIRKSSLTDHYGTTGYGIVSALSSFSFDSFGVACSLNDLYHTVPLPCIIHVKTDGGENHFVVLFKSNAKKKQFKIGDPAHGIVQWTEEQLQAVFTNKAILAIPKPDIQLKRVEKPKIALLMDILQSLKIEIGILFSLSFVNSLFAILTSFYFTIVFDDLLPSRQLSNLNQLSIIVLFIYFLRITIHYYRNYLSLRIAEKIDYGLLFSYYQHLFKIPLIHYISHQKGDYIKRFQDATQIKEVIGRVLLTTFMDLFFLVFGVITLYMIDARLFIIGIVIVLIYILISILFVPWIKRYMKQMVISENSLNNHLLEDIDSMETIRINELEDQRTFSMNLLFQKVVRLVHQYTQLINLQVSLKEWLALSGNLIVIWYGSHLVMSDQLTVGKLITFQSLLIYMVNPIRNLIDLQPEIQSASLSFMRLKEHFSYTSEVQNYSTQPVSFKGNIELNEVSFRYGARRKIINQLSLKINAHEHIAIVGESGSGKSTFAKLLLGIYPIEEGVITFDGIPTTSFNTSNILSQIGYISQNDHLFTASIYENLTIHGENNLIQVNQLIQELGLQSLIHQLPLGIHTTLTENGENISGGQRQKLMFLRTILKNTPIFLLDEITSNMDYVSEKKITNFIESKLREHTVITIAHRIHSIRNYDRIIVLKQGKIVEIGNHNELLQQNGEYCRLLNIENGGVNS